MKTLENIDLNLILLLHWLLVERSVTKAGARVGLSQPAASRALGRLRAIFSDELFVQTGRVLTPTKLASGLAPDLENAVRQLRKTITHDTQFSPDTFEGTVRFASNDYLASISGHMWLHEIHPLAPNLQASWRPLNNQSIENIISGHIDFIVAPDVARKSFPQVSAIEDMVIRPFLKDHFVLFGARQNPLFDLKRLSSETLAELRHILVSPSGGGVGLIDEKLAEQNLQRKIHCRSWSFLHAAQLAMASNMVVVLPERLAKTYTEGAYRPLPFKLPALSSFIAWHSSRRKDLAHAWMRQQLLPY